MNKLKINVGLASIILLGGLFSGWSTLLMLVVLMLIFCELTDSVKQVMVKVITFYFGLTLFSTAWGLVVDGVELVITSFDDFIAIINSYFSNPISIYKLEIYLLNPISSIIDIADNIINYLLVFVKFTFIVSMLNNKIMKENFVVKKINNYVNRVVNFINSFDIMQNNNYQNSQSSNSNFQ